MGFFTNYERVDVVFAIAVGVSLLDEDWGTDEVYGLLTLKNLYKGNEVKAKIKLSKGNFKISLTAHARPHGNRR